MLIASVLLMKLLPYGMESFLNLFWKGKCALSEWLQLGITARSSVPTIQTHHVILNHTRECEGMDRSILQ